MSLATWIALGCVLVGVAVVGFAIARAMPAASDVFVRFPSIGRAHLPDSDRTVEFPYHNYDADILLIHGWCSAAAVRKRLPPWFHPVTDRRTGRALASFWVCDYAKTTCGPYKELVVCYTVSDAPRTVAAGSIHAAGVINAAPGVRQYVDRSWVDADLPAEYGRRLLGCDTSRGTVTQISRSNDTLEFRFADGGDALLSGSLDLPRGLFASSLCHLPYVVYEMGPVRAAFSVLNPPEFVRWDATGPPGVADRASTGAPPTASPLWGALFVTAPRFTWHRPRSDILKVGSRFADLDFQPVLYQHDRHLKAVMLGAWGFATRDGPTADAV